MILAAKAAAGGAGPAYQWVAVGDGGDLATSESTTASSWTSRTSSFGATNINYVKADGQGTYVAVGDAGKLATSQDGITWTQRTSSFGTDIIRAVAYGNGYWVAVGAGPKLATSPDGITWTQRTHGFLSTIQNIYYGNGLWVAISTGAIRTATDPTGTWTARTSSGGTNSRWCSAQSIWVAGANASAASNQVESSPDGITWTDRTLPLTTNATPGPYFVANDSVITCLYRSTDYDIASSTNGTTWTDRTPAVTGTTAGQGAVDNAQLIVYPRASSSVETSTDGTTWTSRTGPAFLATCLCHSFGG